MPRQLVTRSSSPPSVGASTGAAPSTRNNRDSIVAAARPVNRSRTTAIATTAPAAVPTPCSRRSTPSTSMLGATSTSSDATTYSAVPASSGPRRPNASESGPSTSWPIARPTRVPVRVSWTIADVVPSSAVMVGSAGRYMSIVSGPTATNAPRRRASAARLGGAASGVDASVAVAARSCSSVTGVRSSRRSDSAHAGRMSGAKAAPAPSIPRAAPVAAHTRSGSRAAATARRASSATRSALTCAPAAAPAAAAAPTCADRSVTLPASHTPGTALRPAASATRCSPIVPSASRTPTSRSAATSSPATSPVTTRTPRAANCSACSPEGAGFVCANRVTSALSCRNSSTWCTAIGPQASTPMAWSRTSQPWQYGQCSTSRPQRSRSPGTSGSSSTSPVVTSSRRARAVGGDLGPPAREQLAGRHALAGQRAVHAGRRRVAGRARVDHHHGPPRAGQHQGPVQPRGASADHHDVVLVPQLVGHRDHLRGDSATDGAGSARIVAVSARPCGAPQPQGPLPAPIDGVDPAVVATFLLLHGGLCRTWVWEGTADALASGGHRVEALDLPSSGPDPAALGGLADDVATVTRALDRAGEGTVLVGHSGAGTVLAELAGHPAVGHSVYVAALRPQHGQSAADLLGGRLAEVLERAARS